MSKFYSGDRLLIGASAVWLAVLCQAPSFHPLEAAFNVTAGLILTNALVSFRALTRKRKVLIGLNCVQIALFGLLNYQLYCAYGPSHYRFDREPRVGDWIEFTGAHLLRAADVLHALDEYGIIIQNISHNSLAAGILLVCMHLTVDVFLIGLVLRWARRHWHDGPPETRLARGRREFGCLLAAGALFVGFAACQQLQPSDWLLWPLDNMLRVLDVGDMFQVFGWKLHQVDATYWTSGAAILFRLAAGIWMARLVIWTRLTLLRTWGVSIDELTQLLDDPDADVRRGAAAGLGRSGPLASGAVPMLIAALRDINRQVRLAAAQALGQIGPAAADAVLNLVDAVWLGDRELRLAGVQALGRIGPNARSAVPSLVTLLKVSDEETRRAVSQALAKIAPDFPWRLPRSRAETIAKEPRT
jgi:HEAT repeats